MNSIDISLLDYDILKIWSQNAFKEFFGKKKEADILIYQLL